MVYRIQFFLHLSFLILSKFRHLAPILILWNIHLFQDAANNYARGHYTIGNLQLILTLFLWIMILCWVWLILNCMIETKVSAILFLAILNTLKLLQQSRKTVPVSMVNACPGKEQIQVTVDKVRRLVDQCEGLQVKWIMEQHRTVYLSIFPKKSDLLLWDKFSF